MFRTPVLRMSLCLAIVSIALIIEHQPFASESQAEEPKAVESKPNALDSLWYGGLPYTKNKQGEIDHVHFYINFTERLDLEDTVPEIRNDDLKLLKDYPTIESVTLYDTWITDAGLVWLRDLPNLKELHLGTQEVRFRKTIPISDEGMIEIAKLPSLEVLTLRDMRITDVGIQNLLPLKNRLRHLTLFDTLVGNEGLAYLPEFTCLEELILYNNPQPAYGRIAFDAQGLAKTLPKIPKLKILRIGELEVTPELGDAIERCKELRSLIIVSMRITPEFATAIGRCENLVSLSLHDTAIEDAELQLLAPLQNLEELTIGESNDPPKSLTDAGLETIKSWKKLKKIRIYGNKVTDEGEEKLRKALPNARVNNRSFQ